MVLEAVWLKNGKEIYAVDPVTNLFCDDNMKDISEIEVYNGYHWYSIADFDEKPDDLIIRIKKD